MSLDSQHINSSEGGGGGGGVTMGGIYIHCTCIAHSDNGNKSSYGLPSL